MKILIVKLFLWPFAFLISVFFVLVLIGAVNEVFSIGDFSTPSFYKLFVHFAVLSVSVALFALLFFLFFQQSIGLKKVRFEKLFIGMLVLGTVLYFFVSIAKACDILPFLFDPPPAIPHATDVYYNAQILTLLEPSFTVMRFRWSEDMPIEERITNVENAIKLYESFAEENKWNFSSGSAEVIKATVWTVREESYRRQGTCQKLFTAAKNRFYGEESTEYKRNHDIRIMCYFGDGYEGKMIFSSNIRGGSVTFD